MARDYTNLQGIYSTLRNEGYMPPDFEVFAKDMEDDSNLEGVRQTLLKHGYTPPDFEVFKSDMFGVGAEAPAEGAAEVPSEGAAEVPGAEKEVQAQKEGVASASVPNVSDDAVAGSKPGGAVSGGAPERSMTGAERLRQAEFALEAERAAKSVRDDRKAAAEARKAMREAEKALAEQSAERSAERDKELKDGISWDEQAYREELEGVNGDGLESLVSPQLAEKLAYNSQGMLSPKMSEGEAQAGSSPAFGGKRTRFYDLEHPGNGLFYSESRVMNDPEDIVRVPAGSRIDASGSSGMPLMLPEVSVSGFSSQAVSGRDDEWKRLHPDEYMEDARSVEERYRDIRRDMEAERRDAESRYEEWLSEHPAAAGRMSQEQLDSKRNEFYSDVEFERVLSNLDAMIAANAREKEEIFEGVRKKWAMLMPYPRGSWEEENAIITTILNDPVQGERYRALEQEAYNLDRLLESRSRLESDGGDEGVWNYMKGVWYGVKDFVMNPFGAGEFVMDTYNLLSLRDKLNAGNSLNAEEQRALEAHFLRTEGESRGMKEMSQSAKAGEFTAGLAEIALEFGLNPASGLTRRTLTQIAKEVGMGAVRATLRNTPGLLRTLGVHLGNVSARRLALNILRVTGAALGEGVTASLTTQLAKNANEIAGRMVSSAVYDGDGDIVKLDGEGAASATAKVVTTSLLTNAAFMFPATFAGGVNNLGKYAEYFNMRGMHIPFGNPADALVKMKTGELAGVLSGYIYGHGDQDASLEDVFDAQSNKELLIGVLTSEFFIAGLRWGKDRITGGVIDMAREKAYTDLGISAVRLGKLFTAGKPDNYRSSELEFILRAGAGMDEADFKSLVEMFADEGRLSKEQKEGALDYMRKMARYRGAEMRAEQYRRKHADLDETDFDAEDFYESEGDRNAGVAEDKQDEATGKGDLAESATEEEIEGNNRRMAAGDARRKGYYAAGADQRVAVSGQYVDAVERLYAVAGGDAERMLMESDGLETEALLEKIEKGAAAGDISQEMADAWRDVVLSGESVWGMMKRHEDDYVRALEEEQRSVGRIVNESGNIVVAERKVGGKVYVVSGDVAMYNDGSGVDLARSSQHIVTVDAVSGEKRMTSPHSLMYAWFVHTGEREYELRATELKKKFERERSDMRAVIDEALGQVASESEERNDGEEFRVRNSEEESGSDRVVTGDEEDEYNAGFNSEDVGELSDTVLRETIGSYSQAMEDGALSPYLQGRCERMRLELQKREGQDEMHGEPVFEDLDKDTAWDSLVEAVGSESDAADIAMAQVSQATAELEALRKNPPTPKAPKLKGSPMAMVQAKREAAEKYQSDLAEYNRQVTDAQGRLDAWNGIVGVYSSRNEELRRQQEEARRKRDAEAHDEAVAQFEEQQRIKSEKELEQERVGVHAVNPKLKEKWDNAPKIEGNADALTLADGSSIRGRYVLTEAGAASASHDVNNAYAPTEGFPIDENGQSVNDRDYLRDRDAQRIVEQMAETYDNRALQTPVIVSRDGVVLSGNNRTMSGDLAARQGTDGAYVDYLREFGQKYGFTGEQVAGMNNPRLVFVPDEALPYDATTFSRFNAQEMKSQSKPEAAVRLGKIVPDNVFNNIVSDISRYDRLSDYYADEKAVAQALGALMHAGVINDKQMPEMRTGTALSAAGKELIENTLIGKVFQTSPDAVRQIISMGGVRQAIVMGLNEIANNRTLARNGYDLIEELSKAVDLVSRAKAAMPEVYTEGMPVSPFGRMQGLFDDEYGESRVSDAVTLMLADVLNSGRPSELRKVLTTYNNEASLSASGQADIFTGEVPSKESILTDVISLFNNGTAKEKQELVDAAIAGRKGRAEAEQRGGGTEVSISSHEIKDKSLKNKMQNDIVLHLDEKLSPSSEMRLTETPSESEGPDVVPTSDNVSSEGKDNTLSADKQTDGAESSEPYTITPTTYTNKKGKTTPMHCLRFSTPLTYEERKALAAFAREKGEGKKSRGWCSDKGTYSEWLFRSEEDARKGGEMIADRSGEAVADALPMTAEELREAVSAGAPGDKQAASPGDKRAGAPGDKRAASPGDKRDEATGKGRKAPINRVSLEDVMTDLSDKGETRLSDDAEPVKTEREGQHEIPYEISDDEMQSLANELRDLLGIGEDEGDAGIKFRDPGELTPQERQRIQSAGIRLAMGLVERGTTSFPDYATKMVGLLGDKIRPWLKSFYEGARWTPGYENIAFTPSEEVARFDVQNFDKVQPTPIEQAAMIVEERKASIVSAQAQRELTEIRNNKRKKQDEQTSADTAALTSKAAAIARKAESVAETSEDAAGLNRAGEEIDRTIEEINDQLALLGYYEAVEDDAKFHESYGYMLTAEKKAVADATKLAKQLVNDLGIDIKVTSATTPLGRKNVKKDTAVRANLAPAGGDVMINLPLNEGRQLAIYISLDPVHSRGGNSYKSGYGYGDNLEVNGIMYRVENPEGKGYDRYGTNNWAANDVTYAEFLRRIKYISRGYLPEDKAVKSNSEPNEEAYHGTVTLKDGREAVVVVANHVQDIGEPSRVTDYIVSVKGEPGTIKITPDDIAHAGAPKPEQALPDANDTEAVSKWLDENSEAIWKGVDAIMEDASNDENLLNTYRADNPADVREMVVNEYIDNWLGDRIGDMETSNPIFNAWFNYDQRGFIGSVVDERMAKVVADEAAKAKAEESHNGYKRGDEVLWDRYGNGKWEKQRIVDFENDGRPIFDSMGMGVMMEIGDWSRVKPADGIFGEAKRVATMEQADRKKKEKQKQQSASSRKGQHLTTGSSTDASAKSENKNPVEKGWTLKPTSILSSNGNSAKIEISIESAKENLDKVAKEFSRTRNSKGFIAEISKALKQPLTLLSMMTART